MPNVKASPFPKIFPRLSPACWMNPKILSEITGSTHGIRLRMKPPMKPKRRNLRRLPAGISATAGASSLATAAGFVPNDQA